MNLYLDASVLVPLFVHEAGTPRARAGLQGALLWVSEFAAAEFSAAISRRTRTGEIPVNDAPSIFAAFDAWTARAANRVDMAPADSVATISLVRRLDLALRAPDAINIIIAQRCGATLFTFDRKMAAAARSLGLDVID